MMHWIQISEVPTDRFFCLYCNKPSHSCVHVYTHTAVAVSFVPGTYSGTEGIGLQAVDVCVQIVLGTLDNDTTVGLWTVSQTATGM